MDTKIINKVKRQRTLMAPEMDDMSGYDDIVAMKNEGIPGIKGEAWYTQFTDTQGRDVVQQAVNIYATQSPKWEVIPRGVGDTDTAEEFERTIEWNFWRAAQRGRKPFHSEALVHLTKYNKACAQLEWEDEYSFCVKMYHPASVVYEMGSKLHWVAVVTNVYAVDILQHWDEYAKPGWLEKLTKGDEIGSALKKIQKLVDEDEEQRMVYVDYTDSKTRYVYCYPVSDESIDDDLGTDDDGKEVEDLIVIQNKENKLGFINWAIAENEGEPLLAPLLKGGYYRAINDIETVKASTVMRRAFFPLFIQDGQGDVEIDYKDQDIIKNPVGVRLTAINPPPIDPAVNELSAQYRNFMTNSIGLGQTASMQTSNVQHSTLDAQIKLRLAQLEPNKRGSESLMEQLAYLMFRWAKKNAKVLKAIRLVSRGPKTSQQRGAEISIKPDQINLDGLYIKCEILANNSTDIMQRVNSMMTMKQARIAIPDEEMIERLNMGVPAVLRERFEEQELRNAVLEAKMKQIISKVDTDVQKELIDYQAMVQMQTQKNLMGMQQPPEGGMVGNEAPQQGMDQPVQQMAQGPGFNAAEGGTAPQTASPEITQAMGV